MVNVEETIGEIVETLNLIEQDTTVPKNVRTKVKSALVTLMGETTISWDVRFDKVIQELDNLSEDPNLPAYTRTQIWNVMSVLESR